MWIICTIWLHYNRSLAGMNDRFDLFCSDVLLPFSHIPRCIHAKTPDFPRLFEPRDVVHVEFMAVDLWWYISIKLTAPTNIYYVVSV